ncbi:MAG: DUF4153 domain-containing protein [Candidatus Limnocylindrales bacterium]
MDRPVARRLLVGALFLGLLAEVVLDGPAFGINIAILVVAALVAGWLLRRRDRAPDPLDTWLPVTAVVLAAFVAIRADPFLALVDTFGAALFLGASIAAFSGLAVTRRSAAVITFMATWTLEAVVAGTPRVVKASRGVKSEERDGWTGDTDPNRRRIGERGAAVARGLVIGIPLAMIFAVLFASADPIFRRGLDDLLGWQIDLSTVLGRVLFIAAITWLSAGLLSIAAFGIPAVERSSLGAQARATATIPTGIVGATEAIIVLVIVDLVVGLFVGLQVAYLFGGQSTLVAVGLTYSDYARRGFFELVAAACLAGGVVVALETTVARRSRPYLALLLGLIGLTTVVLVSAALRLRLYQDAYGWTELRLYVLTAIAALGAALVVMVGLALLGRMQWLGHGLAVIGVVALVGLNLVAPAGFVAQRNVERILDPSLVPPDGQAALDAIYLGVLPDDAVPALVAALPALPESERREIRSQLAKRQAELAADPAHKSPAAWNLGRERAREALATLQ